MLYSETRQAMAPCLPSNTFDLLRPTGNDNRRALPKGVSLSDMALWTRCRIEGGPPRLDTPVPLEPIAFRIIPKRRLA